MPQGYFALVLHAHLPFVKHPEYPDFLEEDWFFEAAVETYLPLLEMFERLEADGIPYGMTMVVMPSLAAMMSDPHHQQRLRRYIEKSLVLLEREKAFVGDDPNFAPVVEFYRDRLSRYLDAFVNRYHFSLIEGLRHFDNLGHLELITCAATHGLLPVLLSQPEAVRAQISVGASEFERHFGRRPRGIWLPECAYTEGIENFLADEDIRFFIVDTHCMQLANPSPVFGNFAPIYTPSGVAAFGRDVESSKQVWSSKEGYPGDVNYREFYRDVGYDRPFEYIRDFVQPTGLRKHTGLKYYRITGDVDLSQKQPYNRQAAMERIDAHAGNFMFNRELQIKHLNGQFGRPPIVVAPYDAELFGHWWFEGTDFIEMFFRKSAYDQDVYECVNLSGYLQKMPLQQVSTPATGSWGDKGYFEVWVNDKNDYAINHLHQCAIQMIDLVDQFPDAQGVQLRALNQCARELLLAQSSDWPFIITTDTMVDYAHRRIREHVLRFLRLADQIRRHQIDEKWLGHLEHRDSPFPDIDYRIYKRMS